MREGNTFGVKLMKSILILLIGSVALYWVLDPLFSIFGPFIKALPFETPMNFVVADYVGMTVMGLSVLGLLWLTKKWGWR